MPYHTRLNWGGSRCHTEMSWLRSFIRWKWGEWKWHKSIKWDMSWFRCKVEVFTPEVLYYVKNCTEENMTVMFREILLFLLSRHTRWCKKEKNTERGNEIGNEFYLQHAKILNSCRRREKSLLMLCNNRFFHYLFRMTIDYQYASFQ